MTDELAAISELGVLAGSHDVDERRAAAHRLVRALTPADAHESTWARLLRQPGPSRLAALACFAAAGQETAGSWRPADELVAADWDGLWALVIHGFEAETSWGRWLDLLVMRGPATAAADLVAVVRAVRSRIDEQSRTGRWLPDPDDPTDEGGPVSSSDRELLAEGATRLDAWLPTLTS